MCSTNPRSRTPIRRPHAPAPRPGSAASGAGDAGIAHQARGRQTREGFVKVQHSSAMLSLDNALKRRRTARFRPRVRELLGGAEYRYVTS